MSRCTTAALAAGEALRMNNSPRVSGLIAYFVLAYAFTWAFHLAIPVFGIPMDSSPAMLLYALGILGPCAAAVVVSAWSAGRRGVRELLATALRWRFGWVWWGFATLLIPVVYLLATGLSVATGGTAPSPLFNLAAWPLVAGQVVVMIGEEYGWRGFALPRLLERFGALGASLILGVLWASWHLPMFFVPGSPQYGSSFFAYLPMVLILTILMTLLYIRTGGSVLACMLFHASLNAAAFVILVPAEAFQYAAAAFVGLVILAVVLFPRPLFTRPRLVGSV
jgi:membrane protease YdiL (CAAX protease family)